LQSSWNALLNMEEFWMKSLVQGGCCFGCDGDCVLQIFHTRVASQLKSKIVPFLLVCTIHVIMNQFGSCHCWEEDLYIYIYIYKQGWKTIHKKYTACRCKCKQMKGKSRPSKQ
jgi:hypothetical protein